MGMDVVGAAAPGNCDQEWIPFKLCTSNMRMEKVMQVQPPAKVCFHSEFLCDILVTQMVHEEQVRQWCADHADFIAAYNTALETEGLPLDEWRTF
jgi:hypothetical protein